MTKRLPLVVILGATACGKSKLAIDLARRFNGEILSVDSMQVYKGLDIVTNKVTEEEQIQAKHHMIDVLEPHQRFNVIDFRLRSLSILDDLLEAKKLPIIVGGTNYYMESIIWKNFLLGPTNELTEANKESPDSSTTIDAEIKLIRDLPDECLHTKDDIKDVETFFSKPIYNFGLRHIESESLWEILEQVDPKTAHWFHPRDKRRIVRCLQVIQEKRKTYGEMLTDVNKSEHGDKSSLGGPLRFSPTCVIWLSCDKDILHKALEDRVDLMLERGLLAELERFHLEYNAKRLASGQEANYEQGIFQTIGFKEFHDYLTMSETERASDKGQKVLQTSIQAMKQSTKRYAKRQLSWIKRRFLQPGARDLPPIFKLPTVFDESKWQDSVMKPAIEIVDSFVSDRPLEDASKALQAELEDIERDNQPGKYYCETCDKIFIGSKTIETHLKSRVHKRRSDSLSKRAKRLEEDQQKQHQDETLAATSDPSV